MAGGLVAQDRQPTAVIASIMLPSQSQSRCLGASVRAAKRPEILNIVIGPSHIHLLDNHLILCRPKDPGYHCEQITRIYISYRSGWPEFRETRTGS